VHDLIPFALRRDEARDAGLTATVGLLLDLTTPPDPSGRTAPRCRLCTATAVLEVSVFQFYRTPDGQVLDPDADFGLGVCDQCAERHAPGLLDHQRAKTCAQDASRHDPVAMAAFTAAHHHIRTRVPTLLRALGLDEVTARAASAMPDPYDS
jgi:hypothetical protein